MSRGLIRRLASELSSLRSELTSDLEGAGSPPLAEAWRSLANCLEREVSLAEAADSFAQAIVCVRVLLENMATDLVACRGWFLQQAAPWEQFLLEEASAACQRAANADGASWQSLIHLFEHLLRHDQPDRRKRSGVFYTPQPIVRYMLRQIDQQLCEELSLPQGLADGATWGELRQRVPSLKLPRGGNDGDSFVRLFDPAVGTGAFLLDAIDFIHLGLTDAWQREGLDDNAIADRWNDYVPRQLLPRLWGMELLPAPCFLARLHVALKLAQTGYRFHDPGRIEIHLGNTLAGPSPPLLHDDHKPIRCVRGGPREVAYDIPFTVVLGNPPFSYLSENQSHWITSLVRGENGHVGYLHADGQKLGEKKTWLHDDYVKFLRYAQWRIETTGCGIVALVTNHGYLTNATFRILRQQLLRAFPRISVIDLHGNRKAREVAPGGDRDTNVFGLDQGIAIGFFRRPPGEVSPKFQHAEVWGSRNEKFERLSGGRIFNLSQNQTGQIENLSYIPAAPQFQFAPSADVDLPEYAGASSLTDLLPLHASAAVTARDHFVLAFTRCELCERIESFRDLSISDDEIRRRYFTRRRSPRYQRGDTRGWKLADARRILAAEENWQSFLQPCQYRPLDWRWIFWHPAMIDWPRAEVTKYFTAPSALEMSPEWESERVGKRATGLSAPLPLAHSPPPAHSLALIARRQIPPSEPCNYFWATSALTLDGIIRNDNRGSESLFLRTDPAEPGDVIYYAYALFHAASYRHRYAAALHRDFPRVLLPGDEKLAEALTQIGRQLIGLHTQRPPQFAGWEQRLALANSAGPADAGLDTGGPAPARAGWSHPTTSQRLLVTVAPRFPQFAHGRVWLRDDYSIAAADEGTWQFRVGAHQIARKWLADRRGRPLTEADVDWYGVILDTIRQTSRLMAEVDGAIAAYGGFPSAFRGT